MKLYKVDYSNTSEDMQYTRWFTNKGNAEKFMVEANKEEGVDSYHTTIRETCITLTRKGIIRFLNAYAGGD